MIIAKVVGNIWATRKEEALVGRKLLMVEPCALDGTLRGEAFVAVDSIDAGEGEMVVVTMGSSARRAHGQDDCPVDASVVAIIDIHEVSKAQGKKNG